MSTADAERPRRRRRVRTPPVPGSDPEPGARAAEALGAQAERAWGANDAQLQQDVPPHWG